MEGEFAASGLVLARESFELARREEERLRSTKLESISLLAGGIVAFIFLGGQLNAASSSFTALLMGLGTDFTIVMYARYVEERQAEFEL